ncbi:MAG: DeoR/GlpR family DNA-binding transcription regulator [Atopobiaceae bacterium]|jgi:DeoR family transcriptional regulator of aga operon|nr:DeoR/GlpR family DNA-binding transcription regulator [Atopobiaceae bacterium]MCH4214063.1 DeoR/GlpR family DNA-binding transcription regulator [Atopobiaceae bacterium]MCH4229526.1 DeoR/GlpR family DNA-binding transcription regulator [Atopobiaceae bacterium]MCH4276415.1 DeoR/GlpR family DNA-binding transcription regulator [Atopobiaceae bacterium]MCI1226502.1 DeoR/GlpR family DNA-binding transcription regulator [Atopobiaceae bacterium]
MALAERRDAIVRYVNVQGSITFSQLKARFSDVSEMTLRTDLKSLDEEHRLVRVHDGARSVEVAVGIGSGDSPIARAGKNVEAKHLIAQKAAKLVRPGTTVFVDSGSTTAMLASYLPDEDYLVFSNSIATIVTLSRLERLRLIVPGGNLNRRSMSLNGSSAVEAVRGLAFDQMFLGVSGYRPELGLTCTTDEEVTLKRTCVHQSAQVIALMDSAKVDCHGTFSICGLSVVDVVVSDGHLPASFLDACRREGVDVL